MPFGCSGGPVFAQTKGLGTSSLPPSLPSLRSVPPDLPPQRSCLRMPVCNAVCQSQVVEEMVNLCIFLELQAGAWLECSVPGSQTGRSFTLVP